MGEGKFEQPEISLESKIEMGFTILDEFESNGTIGNDAHSAELVEQLAANIEKAGISYAAFDTSEERLVARIEKYHEAVQQLYVHEQ